MTQDLKHFGVLGMKWGRRKNRSSSSSRSTGGRKTAWGPTNQDGRKVNKLFGKRNMKKVKEFFFGSPENTIKMIPMMNKKYRSLDKEGKKKYKRNVDIALKTISVIAAADLALMLLNN